MTVITIDVLRVVTIHSSADLPHFRRSAIGIVRFHAIIGFRVLKIVSNY